MDIWLVILAHQLIFQGMFVTKNITLAMKIKKRIRGNNSEANISIAFFALFILVSLAVDYFDLPYGEVNLLDLQLSLATGLSLLVINVFVAARSLIDLKESWRVGVVDEQKTDLVLTGIYRHTRNPYFLSYILMFAAYTIMLQNFIVFLLSLVGVMLIHRMIIKEEAYLLGLHGKAYVAYKASVPRYLII